MSLSWKSSWGCNEIRIFDGNQIVGIIKSEVVGRSAYGELYGTMLRFKSKGFWKRSTDIFDIEGRKQLGEIKYNLMKGSAAIDFEEDQYQWRYDGWLRKSWHIKDSTDTVNFRKTRIWHNEGRIENDDLQRSAILIGLYINLVFQKLSAGA